MTFSDLRTSTGNESNSSSTAVSELYAEMREKITLYAEKKISLAEFNRWFAPLGWTIDEEDDSNAEELASDVLLCLSEFDHGDWSEDELRNLLLNAVRERSALTVS